MPDYARCNFDGKPLSPKDQIIIATFKTWLSMDDDERRLAVRLDPEWARFAGIPEKKP